MNENLYENAFDLIRQDSINLLGALTSSDEVEELKKLLKGIDLGQIEQTESLVHEVFCFTKRYIEIIEKEYIENKDILEKQQDKLKKQKAHEQTLLEDLEKFEKN